MLTSYQSFRKPRKKVAYCIIHQITTNTMYNSYQMSLYMYNWQVYNRSCEVKEEDEDE